MKFYVNMLFVSKFTNIFELEGRMMLKQMTVFIFYIFFQQLFLFEVDNEIRGSKFYGLEVYKSEIAELTQGLLLKIAVYNLLYCNKSCGGQVIKCSNKGRYSLPCT